MSVKQGKNGVYTGTRVGENIGKDVTIQGFMATQLTKLMPLEDIVNMQRGVEGNRFTFTNMLPPTIFESSLIDGCATLESSCASKNSMVMDIDGYYYMNEEHAPQTKDWVPANVFQDYVTQTLHQWADYEASKVLNTLEEAYETYTPPTGLPNKKIEILRAVAHLENTTGISRNNFSIVMSQACKDDLTEFAIEIPQINEAYSGQNPWNVGAVKIAPVGYIKNAEFDYMVFVKAYAVAATGNGTAPTFSQVHGKNNHPNTFRYFADNFIGVDLYNAASGVVVYRDAIEMYVEPNMVQVTFTGMNGSYLKVPEADSLTFSDDAVSKAYMIANNNLKVMIDGVDDVANATVKAVPYVDGGATYLPFTVEHAGLDEVQSYVYMVDTDVAAVAKTTSKAATKTAAKTKTEDKAK